MWNSPILVSSKRISSVPFNILPQFYGCQRLDKVIRRSRTVVTGAAMPRILTRGCLLGRCLFFDETTYYSEGSTVFYYLHKFLRLPPSTNELSLILSLYH